MRSLTNASHKPKEKDDISLREDIRHVKRRGSQELKLPEKASKVHDVG